MKQEKNQSDFDLDEMPKTQRAQGMNPRFVSPCARCLIFVRIAVDLFSSEV